MSVQSTESNTLFPPQHNGGQSVIGRFGDLSLLEAPATDFGARTDQELTALAQGNVTRVVLPPEHTETLAAAKAKLAEITIGGLSDRQLAEVAAGGLAKYHPELAEEARLVEWAAVQANKSLGYAPDAEQPGRHHAQ